MSFSDFGRRFRRGFCVLFFSLLCFIVVIGLLAAAPVWKGYQFSNYSKQKGDYEVKVCVRYTTDVALSRLRAETMSGEEVLVELSREKGSLAWTEADDAEYSCGKLTQGMAGFSEGVPVQLRMNSLQPDGVEITCLRVLYRNRFGDPGERSLYTDDAGFYIINLMPASPEAIVFGWTTPKYPLPSISRGGLRL